MANPRSRNYPALSLGEAISRAGIIYKAEGRARIDAETAVRHWGYGSLNGSSLRVLSALRQFGLVDGSNEDIRLSERALTLLVEPETSPDYSEALRAALLAPALFSEIVGEYGEELPSDQPLISYLVRKQKFGEASAKALIESFRESVELVRTHGTSYIPSTAIANVVAIERPSEAVKAMQNNILTTIPAPQGLTFSSLLSVNSVLTVSITGKVPTLKQLKNLSRLLELAKDQFTEAVESAEEDAARDAVDYTVG